MAFELQLLGDQSVCEASQDEEEIECDPLAPYRTIDGTCNNLENPTWGATFTPLRRAAPTDYGDGEERVIGS